MPFFRALVLLLGVLALVGILGESDARAAEPETVVVEVDDGSAILDVEKLRAALSEELHATAVAPDDPRAPGAKGTLRVEVYGAKHAMRITYLAKAAPTVRTVALPADPDTARREAVLVAGNLARDEGAELARDLRRKREAAAPSPTRDDAPRPSRVNVREILEYYAAQDRRFRRAVLFGVLGVAATGIGVGTAVYASGDRTTGPTILFFSAGGALYAALGFALAPDSPFEELLGKAALQPIELDEAWANAAADEMRARRFSAILGFAVAGVGAGLGTWALVDERTWGANRKTDAGFLLAYGAFGALAGVIYAATDGPLETSLRVFEKTSGRAVRPSSATAGPRFSVSPIAGGAMVGLGGVF